MFLNLIVNAAQSLVPEKKGIITLRSGHDKTHVWFEVADNGCGMDDKTLSKIFDPFFTTKSTGQGTGLGLSVTLGIVQRHGGTISAQSQLGAGTCFRVTLPIRQPPANRSAKETA